MATESYPDLAALGDELLRLQRRRTTTYAGSVLDTSAFRILRVLSDGEPRTMRQLAEELELEQSTVNRQVHAAIDAGHLERYDVEGSVSKLLRPTASGLAAFDHDGRLRAALIQGALDALGPGRGTRLVADLKDFNDAWDEAVSGVSGGPGTSARRA